MKDWRYLLAGIFAALFCLFTDHLIVSPIAPQMAKDLGYLPQLTGLIGASYSFFVALSALICAPFTDSMGRRWFVLWAGGLFFLSLLTCALAQSFGMLLLARSLNGIAAGPLISCLWALPGDEIPGKHLNKAYGIIGSAFGFSASVGMLVVTSGTQWLNWRAAFFGLLMLYIPAWLFLLTWSYRPWRPRRVHFREYFIHLGQLLQEKSKLMLILTAFLGSLAVYSSQFNCGNFFQLNMGYTVNQTGYIYCIGGITTIAGSLCMPYLTLVMTRSSIICLGFIGGCLLWPLYYLLGNEGGFLAVVTLLIFWLIFFITAFGYSGLTAHISLESTDSERGRMLSFQNVSQSLGIAVGNFWPTFFITQGYGGKWLNLETVAVVGILPALCVWISLHLAENFKEEEETAAAAKG